MGKNITYNLPTCVHILPIEKANEEFTLVKIYVHGIGKNRNYSFISKEVTDKAAKTLGYIPVVGHLIPELDEDGNIIGYHFGGHDVEVNWDTMEIKPLTVPYGVVIDNTFEYETINESGQDVVYRTAYAYLWTKRYPELAEAIYDNDIWFNQSMEISVEPSCVRPLAEDGLYTEITDFTYSALCILGKSDDPAKHTEPCFISSQIILAEHEFEKSEFNLLMSEIKESLAHFCLDKNSFEKGGTISQVMEEKKEVINNDECIEEDKMFNSEKETTVENEVNTDNFSITKEEYDTLIAEIDELRSYKEAVENEKRKAEYEAILDKFEELSGIEEFDALRTQLDDFATTTELEEKCYAIKGRNTENFALNQINFSKGSAKIGILTETKNSKKEFYEEYFGK